MKISPFHTERFFAIHEFSAPYLLCASDCESLTVDELLELAGVSWESLGQYSELLARLLSMNATEQEGGPDEFAVRAELEVIGHPCRRCLEGFYGTTLRVDSVDRLSNDASGIKPVLIVKREAMNAVEGTAFDEQLWSRPRGLARRRSTSGKK